MSKNVFRYLTDDGLVGDGTNHLMVVGAADIFYAGPAAGKVWDIHRAIFLIEDATTMTASLFGGISALGNGCTLTKTVGGPTGAVVLDLLDGNPIKKNGDFGGFCYDVNWTAPGQGNDLLLCRWTFAKSGSPLQLVGAKTENLVFGVNDALTGLVDFSCMIQGIEHQR